MNTLRQHWLRGGVWFVTVLAYLCVYAVDLPLSFSQISQPCNGPECHYQAVGNAEALVLAEWGLSTRIYAVYMLGITVISVVIFCLLALIMLWRLFPQLPGMLYSAILIIIPTTAITNFDVLTATYPAWAIPIQSLFVAGLMATGYFIMVFPNGRLAPRVSMLLPVLLILANAVDQSVEWVGDLIWLAYLPLFAGILLVAIYRYGRLFNQNERQQARWVIFGFTSYLAGVPLWAYVFALAQPAPGVGRLLLTVGGWTIINFLMLILPFSIFAAILRYRLWDVDLIINRTLVYGGLSVIVVSIYTLIVASLSSLLQSSSNFGVALIATGIIVILFQPLREGIQRAINRFMFGDRDDPYAVVSRLSQQLGEIAIPGQTLPAIASTIAQTLKLPFVAIELLTEDERQLAASYGQPIAALLEEWPLRYQGEVVGWLKAASRSPGEQFTPKEQQLLGDIAAQAGAAAYAVRLTTALQRSRERLVLLREEERRRIRRDLHDGLGPTLASQTLTLDAVLDLLHSNPVEAARLLRVIKHQNQEIVAEIRRLVHELRPPALEELGLVTALQSHIAQLSSRSAIKFSLNVTPDPLPPMPAAVEVAAYRIVLEAITNVVRHAQAQQCWVHLEISPTNPARLTISIKDDGAGLAPGSVAGVGLHSMRERAEELGGSLTITARNPGLHLSAWLPVDMSFDQPNHQRD